MTIDSREVEWVRKKITRNKSYLAKCRNEAQYRAVQADTMFLEKEILPILLNSTILYHSEATKYFIRAFDAALSQECNGMLIYLPIREEYEDRPVIGVSNCRADLPLGTPGALEIEIINMDGNGAKVKPVKLEIE